MVLATNVAETSLTVPGIRYVIDTGTARISRYSARTKVQRLPIEPISQASANQRAGRCGRVAPGVCIRLYSEEDFDARPEFTEPEILRTNLASVILQMTAADLGDIASFPFVEAPDNAQITDGLRLLDELGALSEQGKPRAPAAHRGRPSARRTSRSTPGWDACSWPAERQGCLREMLIIVAGLSIQDPRERPAEQREKADTFHRRFWAPPATEGDDEATGRRTAATSSPCCGCGTTSAVQQHDLSGNAFRRLCRDEYLHFLRVREWQDLHTQLRDIVRDLKLNRNDEPAAPDEGPHRRAERSALATSGSPISREDTKNTKAVPGRKRRRDTVRGSTSAPAAASSRSTPVRASPKIQPPLVMAAEIVETTRLWARGVAGIDAAQIEEVGQHLLKRNYSEPHWSSRSGSVMAYEQVSLYGIPIIAQRPVSYARIDPVEAREIFLRSALVEQNWRTRHHFFARNAATRVEADELEERTRRRDVVVDDQVIFDFYDTRVPAEATSGAEFDAWWKNARHVTPELLDLTLADLVVPGSADLEADAFPDHWTQGDLSFAITYAFDPGSDRDGVSVTIDLAQLNQVEAAPFSRQVPGLRTELATELIRSLPKSVRTRFVPAPEFAKRALGWLRDHPADGGPETTETFAQGLARALRALTGEIVAENDWRSNALPPHVEITFVITDPTGVVAYGKDLDALKIQLSAKMSKTLSAAAAEHTVTGATRWVFGPLAPQVELVRGGQRVVGYPALTDEGTTVGQVVLDTEARQARSHRLGTRRLVLLNTPDPTKWVVSHLSNTGKLALGHSPYGGVPALLADARLATVGALVERHAAEPVRDEASFTRLCDLVRADQADFMRAVVDVVAETLTLHQQVLTLVPAVKAVAPAAALDLSEQVANLLFSGFIGATAYEHLVDLPRYLKAVLQRITIVTTTPSRDATGLAAINNCEDAYAALCDAAPPGPLPPVVEDVGWLLEELRVGLFAQGLRTKVPVSEKRVMSAIRDARGRL